MAFLCKSSKSTVFFMQHEKEQYFQSNLRKIEFRRKGTVLEQGGEKLKERINLRCTNLSI